MNSKKWVKSLQTAGYNGARTVGYAKSMPFASINPTNPRTNPRNFSRKNFKDWRFWKISFFLAAILKNKISKFIFFCFILMLKGQIFLVSKVGSKFWWLPWFPAVFHPGQTFCTRVHEQNIFWNFFSWEMLDLWKNIIIRI